MDLELPPDFWEKMPPETYCKCGATWATTQETPTLTVSMRIQCLVCGFWTGPVPTSTE